MSVMTRIHPMRADDATRVAELSGQLGYPATAEQIENRLSRSGRVDGSCVLVAEDAAGAVVGWVHILERHVLEAEPHAEIGGLVVEEGARRSGVGRALVAAAERWAAERGFSEVVVRTNVVRPGAPAFYGGVGYELVKTSLKFRKRLRREP